MAGLKRNPEERMQQITGGPERVSALPSERFDERHLAAIERLRVFYGYPEGLPAHSFYSILAHSPDIFAGFMDLGIAITAASALPARWREMLILRTGWLCGAPYQWGEHVIAARLSGLNEAETDSITIGSTADHWNEQDRCVLRAAEELHADAMIGEETWQVLAGFLNERQLLEVPMVVGHYHMTAFVQNTLRVALNAHNPGLGAR